VSSWVVDASALLALLQQEPGADQVAEAIAAGAVMSRVNVSEVVAKLSETRMTEPMIRRALELSGLEEVDFSSGLAYQAGLLRRSTRQAGLSLGDRACLVLAQELGLPVLTADRAWQQLQLGIRVEVLR
jgi:PIN domain nuclease of toxin-antitoxin system